LASKVLANHACVVIWGDILTLRYGRASWRNQLSRVDGLGIAFLKRDAAYRAVAQRRGVVLLNRGKFVDWAMLTPLLVSSVPTALVGGLIVLDERRYKTVTGLVLLSRNAHDGETDRPIPLWGAIIIGAAVGFVSGITGVGGGVFLAPILIALHWASPRQTAALSSPFIWANSVVGLAGAICVGQTPSVDTWLYALATLAGAMIGTNVGLRWLSQTTTRYLLAAILGAAGIQLLVL
jgi:uncharacterized protein